MDAPSPQLMLTSGILLSFIFPKSKLQSNAKLVSTILLQISVVLLGASLNFNTVIKQGAQGLFITFFSILSTFIVGQLGWTLLKIERQQGLLITMGTAICGGSAISTLAPIIRADSMAITISIAVVFLLNALAIFIFPPIGEAFALSQEQFGLWAALAIHDTSSVVAASTIYGERALEIATTFKLTRALWIIPVGLFFSLRLKEKSRGFSFPWFIFGFILLSVIFTFGDSLTIYSPYLSQVSKMGFAFTLFFIGLTFDVPKIKQVGLKPLAFGVGLWIFVSFTSLIILLVFPKI